MDTEDTACTHQAQEEIAQCRAAAIGVEKFAECLCEGPNACQYALPFGYAFLCQHPRVKEIVENTKKSLQDVSSV